MSCITRISYFSADLLFMMGGIWFMRQHYEIVGSRLFYVILPLLLIAVYCLLPDSPLPAKQTRILGLLIIISILLLMLYFSVLCYWVKEIDWTESGPFGIPLEETGYYMDRQLRLVIIMQLGIFVLSNILIFCGYRVNRCIYGLSLTGAYLATGCSCLLHNMTTVEKLYSLLLKMTVCIIIEGIVFSVAAYIFTKKNQNSSDRMISD